MNKHSQRVEADGGQNVMPPGREQVEIGEQLRKQRKARGISIIEVAEHTKIGKRYLEGLEEGRFEIISCDTYILGFLRAYAKYLEMDEEQIVNQYKRMKRLLPEAEEEPPEGTEESRESNQSTWLPLLSMLFLAGLGAGIFLLWPKAEHKAPAQKVHVQDESGAESGAQNVEQLPGRQEEMTLKIKAKEKTWITIMADGRQEPDITLKAGQERTWRAKERFMLWTGNAGGIEVTFNGELQPSLGRQGDVRKEVVFERKRPKPAPEEKK
jgi:cytoskeletal protein RodZ